MEFTSQVITLNVKDHVATLWLDRPDARNALGRMFWDDLPVALSTLANEPGVRALVIAAKGSHFTVGLDLKEFAGGFHSHDTSPSPARASETLYRQIRTMQRAITAVADLEFPVIAAVHGYCLGAGVDLITACDIRLCTNDATFSVRETKVAIVADLGTLQRLPRIVGAGHAAELALTGRDIDAQRAADIGLVNSVHGSNAEDVLAKGRELAHEIAMNSPLAVRGTKAVLAANDGRTIDEGLDFVARWNTMYLRSNDLNEATSAFTERRTANFKGD